MYKDRNINHIRLVPYLGSKHWLNWASGEGLAPWHLRLTLLSFGSSSSLAPGSSYADYRSSSSVGDLMIDFPISNATNLLAACDGP